MNEVRQHSARDLNAMVRVIQEEQQRQAEAMAMASAKAQAKGKR
jgi:hypothetical protein